MNDEPRNDSFLMKAVKRFEADPNRFNANAVYGLARRAYEDAVTRPEWAETCAHCGRPVWNVGLDDQQLWRHRAGDGALVAGCRAGSYVPDEGWDDTLDRRCTARPTRR